MCSGGLVRAYGSTTVACLRAATKTGIFVSVEAKVTCSFSDSAIAHARLEDQAGVRTAAKTFTATGADLTVVLPETDIEVMGG